MLSASLIGMIVGSVIGFVFPLILCCVLFIKLSKCKYPRCTLINIDFEIGPTERAVLASYTMVVPARLHDQCTGTNSQSELVIPNWFYNWFSLYRIPHAHSLS